MNRMRMLKWLGLFILCAALVAVVGFEAAKQFSRSSAKAVLEDDSVLQQTGSAAGNGGTSAESATQEGENEAPDAAITSGGKAAVQATYGAEDREAAWNAAQATSIQLNGTGATVEGTGASVNGGVVTISSPGVYSVRGKLANGQLVVDVQEEGTVRLILNGAEIHNESSAPIYIKQAKLTVVTLQEGTTNLVSDGKTYLFPDPSTDEPNAVIFSEDDLTINGSGSLTVKGNYNNGIGSKDKLKITAGQIEIEAADDGLLGRDLVAVLSGQLNIKAGGDGIKATNDTDAGQGNISIDGGEIAIEAKTDGIQATSSIAINGGTIRLASAKDAIKADVAIAFRDGQTDIAESYEGIESPSITISGGEVRVVSSDDGVNIAAAGGEGGQPVSESGNKLVISGGALSIVSGGDGLDSNGSIDMSGGTVVVHGPTANNNGALDYDGTFQMTGGLLVATGSSGMARATSESSTQHGMFMTYPQSQPAGQLVHLKDGEGSELVTFAPAKDYQTLLISSPSLNNTGSYTLYSGGSSTGSIWNGLYSGGEYKDGTEAVEFGISNVITWLNESGVTTQPSGGRGQRPRGG
ncbi:carbohydrate-binding domain-containing protein [Paenibacillus sp. GCM10027627]|uniref:carbohydrate-binding domain-containing protein n=1 Tax=unclassified Paenibacillus TaxID=185978 RepID=UPI00364373CD